MYSNGYTVIFGGDSMMFVFFLLLFILSIPIKTGKVAMKGIKGANNKFRKNKNPDVDSNNRSLLDRVRGRGKKSVRQDEKTNKAIKSISKLLLKITSWMLGLMKSVLMLLSLLMGGVSILVSFLVVVIASSGFIIVLLISDGTIDFTSSSTKVVSSTDTSSYTDVSGNMVKSVEALADWYCKNITTYQNDDRSNRASAEAIEKNFQPVFVSGVGRAAYACDLLSDYEIYYVEDDCTGYVMACMYLASGGTMDISNYGYNSESMYGGSNTKFKAAAEAANFVVLDTTDMDVSDLKPGDILVHRSGDSGHAEAYLGGNNFFSWGNVHDSYPLVLQLSKSGNNFKIGDSKSNYNVVYRYIGK